MKLPRFGGFAGGIDRIIKHRLHAGSGNVRRLLPECHIGVVGFVEVFLVISLGVFGDDLFGRLGIGTSDFCAFNISLYIAPHFVGIGLDEVPRGRQSGVDHRDIFRADVDQFFEPDLAQLQR